LPETLTEDAGLDLLARRLDGRAVEDGPVARLLDLLAARAPLEALEIAFPDDRERRRRLTALRESAPESVVEIVTERKRADPAVHKVGGDPIVPFEELAEALAFYHRAFADRGVDHAVWGHVSDGNLHPNALPSSAEEVRLAEEAQREIAREVRRRGGCPLSEHGVGRSAMKQSLLREFLGPTALEEMRAVKQGFDPEWRLAPGVLFPREADHR